VTALWGDPSALCVAAGRLCPAAPEVFCASFAGEWAGRAARTPQKFVMQSFVLQLFVIQLFVIQSWSVIRRLLFSDGCTGFF
jgi:hypothetical protein